jgi:dihydroneopterin aldolase
MTAPRPVTGPDTAATARIVAARVFVRAIRIDAEIGIHAHEHGRRQPLLVDVDLDVAMTDWRRLDDTVNYETIADLARSIAAEGHIGLVETFAHRLAEACLAEPRVLRARVRVEKPMALAPVAAGAGVEIIATRG